MASYVRTQSTSVLVDHADGIAVAETVKINGKPKEPNAFPASFYDYFLSDSSKARLPSPIRGLFHLESIPGMISMLAGKPNPALFPISGISVKIQTPDGAGHTEKTVMIEGKALEEALQYGPTPGLPGLQKWLKGLQCISHKRGQTTDWELAVGSGSQDLLYKAVCALVNPGECALVEAPVYGGVIPLLQATGAVPIEIPTDEFGADTNALRQTLENWPAGKPKPKIFYTVPYGCNPSGVTTTLDRRLEVLKLAHEHNFLILEDDPYYYLYFGEAPRPPSYWELEGQDSTHSIGRVLRFDSFSKVLSAGLRMGFVTGPKVLIEAINVHTSSANLQSSSTSQAIAYVLLSDWGYDTFFKHTERVAGFYREKRDVFAKGLEKNMKGLAEWTIPNAGMFFWMKLLLPPTATAAEGDSTDLIRNKAVAAGVLTLPGASFFSIDRATPYVRASFSLISEEDVDEGLRRLAEVVKGC
ncbi:PLP-dependent transferase [Serendipita vermifera]|nr:PLP-dependent transferase [Serendipita vermifera]